MDIQLEKAAQDDFDIVFDILEDNSKWLDSIGMFQWPLPWLRSRRIEILESIRLGQFYTISISNEIVSVVELKSNPEDVWGMDMEKSIYVHMLAVRRNYAGNGLGKAIINKIKDIGGETGVKFIRLDCVSHNYKLKMFYKSCGFAFVREVKGLDVDLSLFELELYG